MTASSLQPLYTYFNPDRNDTAQVASEGIHCIHITFLGIESCVSGI